jgi:hypothetical protein
MVSPKASRYARQSSVRVRSGAMLVGILILIAFGAALLKLWWLTKLGAGVAAFFALVTLIEYLNVRRWERKQ